jgi:transcriptional regulator with GAF, ATPase, and Fis domain
VPLVRLIDLGSSGIGARAPWQSRQGTPLYLAPEILQGKPQSIASDLYAVGAILFECIEGRPPHGGRSASDVLQKHLEGKRPCFDDRAFVELHPLILQMLERDPSKRPSSSREIIDQANRISTFRKFSPQTPGTVCASLESIPLVDRAAILERLLRKLESVCQENRPGMITSIELRGPLGIGKTRLLEEFLLAARLRGTDTLSLNGDPDTYLKAALDLMERTEKTRSMLPPLIIAVDEPPVDLLVLQARIQQLLNATPRAALIISTQDSSWADPCAVPNSTNDSSYVQTNVEYVQPISANGIDQSLTLAFGQGTMADGHGDRLHALTGGNPRLIWDLVKHLLAKSAPDRPRYDPLQVDDMFIHSLPESTEYVLSRWTLAIPDNDGPLMNALAASEEPLSPADLADLIPGLSNEHVTTRCLELEKTGLLQRFDVGHETRFTLPAGLFRRHLLSRLGAENRRQLHEALGRWYVQQSGVPDSATRAAPHFLEAGLQTEALESYLAAARSAASHHDDRQAADMYQRALHLSPAEPLSRAVLVLPLVASLNRVGRASEALRTLDGVRQLEDLPPRLQIALMTWRAISEEKLGRYQNMLGAAKAAVHLSRTHELEPESVEPLSVLGTSLCWLEQWEKGRRALFRAAHLARRHGIRDSAADALRDVALAHWQAGNCRLALNYERRRLRLLPRNSPPWPRATVKSNIGVLLADLGRYHIARRYYRESLRISRRYSFLPHLAITHVNIGETNRSQGSWGRALSEYRKAMEVLGKSGSEHTTLMTHANASHALVRAGYIQEAINRLRHNLGRFSSLGARQVSCITFLGWVHVLYGTGRFRLAHKVAAHACALAEGAQLWNMMLEIKTLMALALVGWGKVDLGRQLLQDAMRRYEDRSPFDARLAAQLTAIDIEQRHGCSAEATLRAIEPLLTQSRKRRMRWHSARCLMLRAQAALSLGRCDEAERDLVEVMENARNESDRSIAWRSAYLLGRAYEQALRYEQALASYRESALTLHELEMNLEDERYRTAFGRLPEVIEAREKYDRLKSEVGSRTKHNVAVLHRSEQVSRKMLASLSAIGQTLSSILDLDQLLDRLLDLAIDNVGAERGVVFLLDAPTGEMRPANARGACGESLDEISTYSHSVIKRAALGEALVTLDVGKEPSLSGYESLVLHSIKSILCVPMRAQGSVIGVIYLDTQRAAQLFTDKERAFVESFASQAAIAIENARAFGRMREDNLRLRKEVGQRFDKLIGNSPAMRRLKDLVSSVVDNDCNVLISGESGTGKELVARAIHDHGRRHGKPFLALDCGALPEHLLEAELFGHARGAFTGADRERTGLFESANGGTLFLDEITNTSISLQARLLRVLQEREVRRLGENRSRSIDVRIIAATNADIKTMMSEGRFRSDLYYRLNVIGIDVPPLKQRREDVPLLVHHFLHSHSTDGPRRLRISPGALSALCRHDWPGNVRELENTVERLAILCRDGVIGEADLPVGTDSPTIVPGEPSGNAQPMKSGEQAMIEEALRFTAGDKAKAARYIGWNRQKLYRRMRTYSIPTNFGKAA